MTVSLIDYGWNDGLQVDLDALKVPDLQPARVVREERIGYVVRAADGDRRASLAGKFRHEATGDKTNLPSVGDWVAIRLTGSDEAVIHALLPRRSFLVRKVSGDRPEPQVLAANVDTFFIVAGLDRDYNPRRIERYLTLAWKSGATPVVVLNKTDLCPELDARIAEIRSIAGSVAVCWTSALEGAGLEGLQGYLGPGRTVAFLGSSGVGKSSLINALLGAERQATNDVRESDSKGRHTTTYRELILAPGGGVVIDTPGIRELQVWNEPEAAQNSFEDIGTLSAACRFNDCQHTVEPGCAILAALAAGELSNERWASFQKQSRELRFLGRIGNAGAVRAEKTRVRQIHNTMRQQGKRYRD